MATLRNCKVVFLSKNEGNFWINRAIIKYAVRGHVEEVYCIRNDKLLRTVVLAAMVNLLLPARALTNRSLLSRSLVGR